MGYTARNRYATTTRQLQRYLDEDALDVLDQIRRRLGRDGALRDIAVFRTDDGRHALIFTNWTTDDDHHIGCSRWMVRSAKSNSTVWGSNDI